jgi:hypothetical protein
MYTLAGFDPRSSAPEVIVMSIAPHRQGNEINKAVEMYRS